MTRHNAVIHDLVGNLVGAGLDHGDQLIGRGHGNGHLGFLALLRGGIDNILAVHIPYGNAGDRALPRDIGDGQGRGGSHHGGNLRRAVRIHRHDGAHHGYIVSHILGEQGADRPVDDPGGQNGLIAGTALPFQEGAGNFAHGVQLFLKVHGQREKVDAVPGLGGSGHRHVHHGVAVADKAGAVGQLGDFSRLDFKGAPREIGFKNLVIFKHFRFLLKNLSSAGGEAI